MYAKVKKTGEILYDAYMDEIDNGYYLVKGIDKEGKNARSILMRLRTCIVQQNL